MTVIFSFLMIFEKIWGVVKREKVYSVLYEGYILEDSMVSS